MITYQIERYTEHISELEPLFSEHYEEVERLSDKIKLSVNHDAYINIDMNGGLLLVTARNNGELIGYILNFISFSLHNKDTLMSTNDALYIKKEYRGNGVFKNLLNTMEEKLTELGVEYVALSVKTDFDIGGYLENKGYTEVERNYEKYLGG